MKLATISAGALFAAAALPGPAHAQPVMSGEQLFKQRCQMCHAAEAGKPAVLGPNLAGVVGRKAAATGFNYSPALRQSGIVWTPAKLDTFLAGPTKLVPGTRMAVVLSDSAQRAAIVDYLKSRQ